MLHNYHYDTSTGPMWCTKLQRGPPTSPSGASGKGLSSFPHVNTLFLGFHHGVTDGHSNMKICGFLVQLLEDVIAGKPIDDNEQLGVFISSEMTEKLIDKHAGVLEADQELKHKTIAEFKAHTGDKACVTNSPYKGDKSQTLLAIRELDEDTTTAFIKRCRAEGVTFHSAFSALLNFASVDIQVDEGIHQDTYSIRSDHVVNIRRYMEGNSPQYLGCHIIPLTPVRTETPRNINGNFWEFARSMNKTLQETFKNEMPLRYTAMKRFLPKNPDFDGTFEFDYCVTNMGDVTGMVTEGGDHIQAIHILRSLGMQMLHCNYNHLLNTFRNRFIHVAAYNSAVVSSEMAEKMCDRVYEHLKEVL